MNAAGKGVSFSSKNREAKGVAPNEFTTFDQEEIMRASGFSGFDLKRILVPTDFSACSLNALGYATKLAREFGAELTLLFVLEPVIPTGDAALDFVRLQTDTEKAARRRLESLARELTNCRAILRVGASAHTIVGVAREMDADLIVIGTHGRSGISRALLGSVAEQVIRHAGCPVFVVREKNFVAPKPQKARAQKELEAV